MPGLGVVAADFDADGWIDLYVAKDGAPNQLWINQKNGRFSNETLLAGAALNSMGQPETDMGVDAGDFDGDGDLDLFLSHLTGETNTLYRNDSGGLFEDRSLETGVATSSFPNTGFGAGWIDYDNDGLLDLLIMNGVMRILEEQARQGSVYPLSQPNQLFRNLGGARFQDVSALAGAIFQNLEVNRGAAFGDIDNNGDIDVVQTPKSFGSPSAQSVNDSDSSVTHWKVPSSC